MRTPENNSVRPKLGDRPSAATKNTPGSNPAQVSLGRRGFIIAAVGSGFSLAFLRADLSFAVRQRHRRSGGDKGKYAQNI